MISKTIPGIKNVILVCDSGTWKNLSTRKSPEKRTLCLESVCISIISRSLPQSSVIYSRYCFARSLPPLKSCNLGISEDVFGERAMRDFRDNFGKVGYPVLRARRGYRGVLHAGGEVLTVRGAHLCVQSRAARLVLGIRAPRE